MKVQSSKFKVQMLFMALCVLLSACTFQTKHRGYVFPKTIDEDISSIKTTAQLIDAVGAPQTKTLYGDEVWIYYGADENYRGPLKHTFTDKTVLLVGSENTSSARQRFAKGKTSGGRNRDSSGNRT